MRKIILILLVLLVSATAFARPVKRIKFPKRATKVVVSGRLNNYNDSQKYLLRLRAGQTLKIESNRSVTLSIIDPAGEDVMDSDASCNSRATISSTVTGDYKIIVVECKKADAWKGNFRLNLSVRNDLLIAVSKVKVATTASDSPMLKVIDVSAMTAEIEKANLELANDQASDKLKNKLADAYFVRAFALTDAAQYRSAIGDFRKGLKLNPNRKDAKEMYDQIIAIYEAIGRKPPKEGEEPLPLPIKN